MSVRSATIKSKIPVISLADAEPHWVFHLESSTGSFSDEDFERFCAANSDLRIEMTKEGEMIIMMPTAPEGGKRNFLLTARFGVWVESDASGIGFDSSTCFTLPNKAKRAPDASWMRLERWEALSEKERNKFSRICPDFVIELRAESDRLKKLQAKIDEYIANGAQLGWLIDPIEKKVHVYRPDAPVEILDQPQEISGGPLLKSFTLKLAGIID